jgi:RNA polymerase sigma-70 factor (ECF subfamily)
MAEGDQAPREQTAEWVRRARRGDREALALLVGEYHAKLVNLTLGLTGNSHVAEDIAQQAWVKACTNLKRLRQAKAFYGWLVRIVLNLVKNRYRSERLRPSAASDLDDSGLLDLGEVAAVGGRVDGAGPTHRAQMTDLQEALDAALAELPMAYRAPLVMFSVDGMPHTEVAEVLGIPAQTVRWRVHQARRMLREMLEGHL